MAFDFVKVFQRALPYAAFLQTYGTADQREKWAKVYAAASLTAEQQTIAASFQRRMSVLCMAGPWCGDCVNACPIFQRIAEVSPLIDLRFVNRSQNFGQAALASAAAPRPGTAEDPNDIRSTKLGKILVQWGVLTPERVDKALLYQEEQKAKGLNVHIGDIMADLGYISAGQRDAALAAQSGYGSLEAWDEEVAKELSICGAPRVPVLVFLSEDGYECARVGERTLVTYREKAVKQLSKTEGASCPTGLMVPSGAKMAAEVAEWFGQFERVQWMLLTSPRLMRLHGEA